jgi:purine-binding chemotaxis protein CheW
MIDGQAILDERARRLAVKIDDAAAAPAGEIFEVATFSLSGERYAIETKYIREIVALADFTPVPHSPNFLFGVVNLHGDVLAVFDLRPLLGLGRGSISDLFRVIVLGEERAEFGVLADGVDEVTTIAAAALFDLPGTDDQHRYVRGVTADALALLDARFVLDDTRFSINDGR